MRDCSNPDDCPLNGLEEYRLFYISADDFNTCSDNSCRNECLDGTIACEEVICDEENGDDCAEAPIEILPVEESSKGQNLETNI